MAIPVPTSATSESRSIPLSQISPTDGPRPIGRSPFHYYILTILFDYDFFRRERNFSPIFALFPPQPDSLPLVSVGRGGRPRCTARPEAASTWSMRAMPADIVSSLLSGIGWKHARALNLSRRAGWAGGHERCRALCFGRITRSWMNEIYPLTN